MIKPDAVKDNHVGEIISLIEKNGFEIVGLQKGMLDQEMAEEFYAVHQDKPFFEELTQFIISGPVIVLALMKEDAVLSWRELMGATNPADAKEGTVRKLYGKSIGNNAVHGSDSDENAEKELEMFFPGISELIANSAE